MCLFSGPEVNADTRPSFGSIDRFSFDPSSMNMNLIMPNEWTSLSKSCSGRKHEPAPCKIPLVLRQVEEGSVVEAGVGLLVYVIVPVLVVRRHGRHRSQLGEEGRVGPWERNSFELSKLKCCATDAFTLSFTDL